MPEPTAIKRAAADDFEAVSAKPAAHRPADFLITGGGEMGKVVAAKDWSTTPLGPLESWPQSLRTTVGLALASNFPIDIIWGPHRIQIYNDGYLPLCGAKHPGSMGQDFKECWAPAWPAIGDSFERACAGETSFLTNQQVFVHRDGYLEEAFFTFSFSPIRDESGKVGGIFHPVTELTQQTLVERRLKVLRDVAEDAFEARTVEDACACIARSLAAHPLDLPFAALYLVDPKGNQARLAASVGLPTGPAFSQEEVDLNASTLPWPLADAARGRTVIEVQNIGSRFGLFTCGPYPELPSAAFVLPINISGLDHPFALLVAGASARRAIDEPYRGFYLQLGETVATVLTNARGYAEEHKRAEALAEIDRVKTAFFTNISHEFRTPLSLMLGPIEETLANQHGILSRAAAQSLTVAHRNSLRLLKLVNALLDFSRIEAGRVAASYEPIDLAVFTAELASMFRSAIEKAGLKMTIDCPHLPEEVYVDREMWEKIVLNLLSNAFKFTFHGEIKVSLRWRSELVELCVSDTGVGIPPQELPRVFERFHRVRGTRSRTHEGTGIGLSLVLELARLHGGDVTAQSCEGKGTSFTLCIQTGKAHLPPDRISGSTRRTQMSSSAAPFIEEALNWLPEEAAEAKGILDYSPSILPLPSVRSPSQSLPRILLVDDNSDMRRYLQGLLTKRWLVETAADGKTALERILACPPDLVLADVMMPGLDGFALLKALRGDERTGKIPIILLSARAGEEAFVEGLNTGADDYLIKPFSSRELMARVAGRLEMARLRRESTEEVDKAEQRFRLFIEHAPVAIAMFDADMRYLGASAQWRSDYNLEPSIVGRSHYDFFPEIPTGWREIHRRALHGEASQAGEDRLVWADGTVRWVKWEIRPWLSNAGEIGGVIIASEHTSQQRKSAEVL